jgi:hypothetical protein
MNRLLSGRFAWMWNSFTNASAKVLTGNSVRKPMWSVTFQPTPAACAQRPSVDTMART